ncbi:MAG: zinc ABC transporter substrate-binding protein [Erysipelotrichaceae bacterium]|nr:zinc ABC transporter substrate-binding protein [Erysipelotrichaceae bacterium]
MKKLIIVIACLMAFLSGCSAQKDAPDSTERKLSVVATIFPEYDWVREIVAGREDAVEVTLLLNNGADLHSYQPSAEDIMKIRECDLFIYVGGESDNWVEDVLERAPNGARNVINLMEVLKDSIYEEKVIEGMQEEDHDHEEGPEYDEHVWLSLRNATRCVTEIESALVSIDPEGADTYHANASAYLAKLMALDEQYKKAVREASRDVLLFGDRFPFRYLTEDYDLDYYAAFVGCSAESEASFETVMFLVNKMDELNLSSICQIESSDGTLCSTILNNSKNPNRTILTFDSMQSVTSKDIQAGVTYYSVMEKNLEVLKQALN